MTTGNRDAPGRLDGDYECLRAEDRGPDGLAVTLRRGYRQLQLTGRAFDFADLGRGVTPAEGRRYRITIEEVPGGE